MNRKADGFDQISFCSRKTPALRRVPLDLSDPKDLWKLIRVAFTIKSGQVAREDVIKVGIPGVGIPLVVTG